MSNNAEQSAFTQEFQVAGSVGKTDYVVGAYYYEQELDNTQTLELGQDTYLFAGVEEDIDLSVFPGFFPADGAAFNASSQEHLAYAVFGQMDYALQESLTLTLGLRYTYEDKSMDAHYTEVNAGPGFAFFSPISPRADQSIGFDDENVSSTIKLSWHMSPTSLLYASYTTGYKAGGTNTDRIPEAAESQFDAETSSSYEAGLKMEFPEQAIRLNIAAYYTEFDDFQVGTFDGTGFNLQNAATVEASGLETEMLWQATESLRFTAAYTHSKSEFDEFEAGNCWKASTIRGTIDPGGDGTLDPASCNRAGGRLDSHPEDYFVGTARQAFPLADMLTAYIYAEYIYVGDQVMESSNDPLEEQGAYELINLRAGLLFEEYDAEIILWGRNVTDEFYYGTNFDPPIQYGKLNAYVREPATYGVTAKMHF